MSANQPTVQLLLTGSEIMSGDTVDSNSSMIAHRLAELGLVIYRKVTVGDEPTLLLEEIEQLTHSADVLIVNGGLGPTVDDLTAQIVAAAAGVELVQDNGALSHLKSWCEQRGAALNAANLKQAMLPAGSTLIENPIGSAVGIQISINNCLVLCTPGVPSELRQMLNPIVKTLSSEFGLTTRVEITRLQTFGLGESPAQQMISDGAENWPAEVELGFRAGAPQMEVKLTIRDSAYRPQMLECKQQIYSLLGDHIIGEGDTLLAERVLDLLKQQGKTLATAESCTGGLIASMLTRIAGSSAAFHAGYVTYADQIKQRALGVESGVLEQHGAVSEAVVRQMAVGAMARSDADYAIAVSGIAGPEGGSEDKPVGTVWLAWGAQDNLKTRCLCWPVERTLFQTMIAAAGLDMIRRTLLGLDSEPRYFAQRSSKPQRSSKKA